ncbi:TonB-dependent receptor domain-containing protein [Flavivirga spongiicola]|uniref:TonB-dependent receptor n=2 Tax=Flavivirga spongiicola TaxID=421621 RepID=A0ABU7XUR7_9FLAO|nr:TonB-dependent receptor [Flavivirga sp. MEBiC05379]MDO5979174.1 TonB-dependent receptor [Flavivirga sp. MEBiC05379]
MFVFFSFGLFSLVAQSNEITVSGTVIESGTNMPVEFATILIADSSTKKAKAGATTNENGKFNLTTTASNFYIEISFIGFTTQTITDFIIENNGIDLGTVTLSENTAELDEVVVQAEKSQTVFKLDKRVFNVGTDLSSTGASTLEILNNVPSVNVNIEGQISLRGSTGVQILINGKPSVLASEESNALGSITADMLEKIEVITNPSAKYDASGTSGIINIVLKKSEKKGLNGSVTLNTGIPNNHSIGLSLNRRTEKFNLFSQIGYGRRTFPRESETASLDKSTGTTLTTIGDSDKNEKFFNIILGTDYHINDLNVITLSGHYAFEDETEHAFQNYDFTDDTQMLTDAWNRNELTTATNPKWEYELQYKKDFKGTKDHNLLFSALGTSFGKDKISNFTNTTTVGTIENSLQEAHTEFVQNEYTFKLDYTHPFAKKYKLEVGAQYVIDDVNNDYEVRDFENNVWQTNTDYSNVFDYNQGVLGLYTTFAFEEEKWGVKGGLRIEDTNLKTILANTNEKNNQKYTNLFPSFHTSYKLTDDVSLQAGYSKRIFRPRLWSLNPFVSFRDNFNLSTGNPNLNPEFTDSFEITSIFKFNGGSLNLGVYHRATEDVIEHITTFEDNVTISKPSNIGTNNATGIELNAKYTPISWLTFTTDFNYNTFKRKGLFESNNFDFSGNRWSSKLTGKIKLPADFTVEATGGYRSKYKNVQSEVTDNLFMNIGVRKKMMKGRLNASLSVRDVFASRNRESITDQVNFYKTSFSQRGRFITLGLSFGFGKGEAMEFSGQKRF